MFIRFALVFAVPAAVAAQVMGVEQVDLGRRLCGEDFLYVKAAASHPRMREQRIECFTIYVRKEGPLHRVDFIAPSLQSERQTPDGLEISWGPPDPKCRSIGFLLDDRRRVVRVILSRH